MSTKSFDFFNSVHAEKKPLQRRQTSQKTESEGNNIAEGTVAASRTKQNCCSLQPNHQFRLTRRLQSAVTLPHLQHYPRPLHSSSLLGMVKVAAMVALSITLSSAAFLPAISSAWAAEDGQYNSGSENGSGNGGARGVAKSLGWVAIGAGLIANVPFIAYVRVRKISVASLGGGHEITRGLAIRHPTMLNLHMAINAVGFLAGIAHGILLIRGLDAISLALAITMTVLVASGIVLRFTPLKNGNGNTKNFARIFHTQLVLSGLLVLLVILHLVSVGVFE